MLHFGSVPDPEVDRLTEERETFPLDVLFIGGPFWDDTGETDPGRVTVATIPEFSDAGVAAAVAVLVLLGVRRRRGPRK